MPKLTKATPPTASASTPVPIEQVQLGVRMEKRMVKVLKAIAETQDQSLGECLEDMYGMDSDVHDAYLFSERSSDDAQAPMHKKAKSLTA